MTSTELAKSLNGMKYGDDTDKDMMDVANENLLVVAFGYSEDSVVLRGYVDEELESKKGVEFFMNRDGLLANKCDSDSCPYFDALKKEAIPVTGIWGGVDAPWTFDTFIEHSTFDIMHDNKTFCIGIVFCMDDVTSALHRKYRAEANLTAGTRSVNPYGGHR